MNLISEVHNKHCFHIVILSTSPISTNEIEWRISMRNVQWNLTQFSIQLIYLNEKISKKRENVLDCSSKSSNIGAAKNGWLFYVIIFFLQLCREIDLLHRYEQWKKAPNYRIIINLITKKLFFDFILRHISTEVWKKKHRDRCPSGCFVIFNKFVNIPWKWMRTNLFIRWNHFNTWF